MLEAETIDVSPPLASDPQPIDNQGSASDSEHEDEA